VTEQWFKGYRLTPVWRQVTPPLAEAAVALWIGAAGLELAEAQRRTSELAFTVRDGNGQLVGMDTVYRQAFLTPDRPWFFLRMFLHPDHRGTRGLGRRLLTLTWELLRGEAAAEAQGVLMVIENPKLTQLLTRRLLVQIGWRYYGQGPLGRDIWYRRFDDLPWS